MIEFYKYIEKELELLIENVKDELKNKAVFKSERTRNGDILATTNYFVKPYLITFYLEKIKDVVEPKIINYLKTIITHEMIHCIQGSVHDPMKEKDAYDKMDKLNIFKNGN